jgi:FkbM family methyltransferase
MSKEIIKHTFNNIDFYFNTTPQAEALIGEIFGDNYKVFASGIDKEFQPGDVVLDLGACEGMFSIMLAKLFPFLKVIALEPVPRTFYQMLRNIGLNGVMNIEPLNIGAAKETGKVVFSVGKNNYSGGSTSMMTFNPETCDQVEVTLFSLDEIFRMFKIDKLKLLKIDIEGMEYDVLYNTTRLKDAQYLVGEFHTNLKLDARGFRIDGLMNYVERYTQPICLEACKMAE